MIRLIELKIAFRSLIANLRRTLLTLFISIIGLTAVLFIAGYINRVRVGLAELLINEHYGHFQIYKNGFIELDDPTSIAKSLGPAEVEIIESLLDREEVEFLLPRITLRGQVQSPDGSITKLFQGYGSDPYGENLMTFGQIQDGIKLSEDDPAAAVVGTGLASKLKLSIGDLVQILVPNEGGGVEAAVVNIEGIADFGPPQLNDLTILVSLPVAQQLQYTDSVQSILVKLEDTNTLETVYTEFLEMAEERGLDIESRTWREMSPFYIKVMRDYTFQLDLIASILLAVILLAVANTVYMSIIERTSEFGTLRAIGISRIEIIRTVMLEGLIIGIISSIIGIALGYGIQYYFMKVYVELPPPPTLTNPIRLSPLMATSDVITYAITITISCFLATIPPSLKASTINIVSAIRHA